VEQGCWGNGRSTGKKGIREGVNVRTALISKEGGHGKGLMRRWKPIPSIAEKPRKSQALSVTGTSPKRISSLGNRCPEGDLTWGRERTQIVGGTQYNYRRNYNNKEERDMEV